MVSLLSQSASPSTGGCCKAAEEALDVPNIQVGLVTTCLVKHCVACVRALISWSTISKSLYLSVSLCELYGLLLKVIHATGQTGSNLAGCYAFVLSVVPPLTQSIMPSRMSVCMSVQSFLGPLFVYSHACHSLNMCPSLRSDICSTSLMEGMFCQSLHEYLCALMCSGQLSRNGT